MSIRYPETVVVLVTAHGQALYKNDGTTGELVNFRVPDGMSMTILNAVPLGVCNLFGAEQSDQFAQRLIQQSKTDPRLNTDRVAFINSLIPQLKEFATKNIDEYIKPTYSSLNIHDKDTKVDPDELIDINYNRQFDNNFSILSKNSGDEVMNKKYSRNNLSEKNTSVWDFKISVLNARSYPDLMQEITTRTTSKTKTLDSIVSLSEIVNYLQGKGVKNIVFLDLSCSPVTIIKSKQPTNLNDIDTDSDDEIEEMDPRGTRQVRRAQIKKQKLEEEANQKAGRIQNKKQTQRKRRSQTKKHSQRRRRTRTKRKRRSVNKV